MSLISDLREAIEHYKQLIEDARNRQNDLDGNPIADRFGKRRRGFGHATITGVVSTLPSQDFQTLGDTSFGGGVADNIAFRKRKPRKPSGDPQLDRLRGKVDQARYRCQQRNLKENEPYYRCMAKALGRAGIVGTGSPSSCKGLFVTMKCPEAEAARAELDAYIKASGINSSKKANTPLSGGGGGGGF